MGNITYSDAIAILQVVYYSPALIGSLYICFRHGLSKALGWFFLVTFCLARLIGASGQLATITNPNSSTAWTIALVCSVMGTSPLLLSTVGILSRIFGSTQHGWSNIFQVFVVRLIEIVALVALILAIVGATSVSNPAQIESNTEVHAAIILFLICYIVIVVMTIIAISAHKTMPDKERVLLKAVALALPFIFVKILYSLLTAFSPSSEFNFATGSKTIDLCMAVLEEMVVVVLYIYAGFRVPPAAMSEDTSPVRTFADRTPRSNFSGRRPGLLALGLSAANAAANAAEGNSRNSQGRDRSPKGIELSGVRNVHNIGSS